MAPYYQDAACTIYHGDMFDVLPGVSGCGAVVTDPPYSSGGAYRGDRAQLTTAKYVQTGTLAYRPDFAGDNRDQRSFLAWCSLWLNAARIATTPGSPLACFIDWRQLPVLTDAVQCGGWTWRNVAVWWKPGIRMQRGRFSSSAEFVVYATNGPVVDGAGSPQNVFSCQPVDDKEHIAQKPAHVMNWVMQVIPAGSVVLDPFMGSGSTLRAAKDMGYKSIGIEVDERYCEMAAKRLQQEVLDFGAA